MEKQYHVILIYDIIDDRKRQKFAKFLLGFGFRIQKSAFEMKILQHSYHKLLREIPKYVTDEDDIRLLVLSTNCHYLNFSHNEDNMFDMDAIFNF